MVNSMSSIVYREAVDTDIPQILGVIKAAFAEYEGRLDPPSSAERKTVEIVRAELREATAVVAQHEQTIIGTVFYRSHGDAVYLDRLAVLSEWRGQGMGRRLMKIVEGKTAELGLSQVTLSVRIALTQNQIYYDKLGYEFVAYGTHDGYKEPTYIVLAKQVKNGV
jgi:predicted N-acetyltransferase YhbS